MKAKEFILKEVSDATKASYKEKAAAQIKELEPHAKKGEYKDLAKNAIKRREKGLERVSEIAGAFPSPSTREKWAKDAAISNAAEAKRQVALKAQADAERLKTNTELVDKEQKTNYHSLDGVAVPPKTNEVAMRMQGSSAEEKAANAAAKQREAEEKAKHLAIVQAYVKIMAAGQPLPPKMQQSYNTMPDFRKEVDAALKNIPGQPGVVDLEQRRNYHLIPKNETMEQAMDRIGQELSEEGKASRALCTSSKPDDELGASQLASCKSQGLRARDGNKSHKLGKTKKSRVKVGGHKIKGNKYGGPLPDWS